MMWCWYQCQCVIVPTGLATLLASGVSVYRRLLTTSMLVASRCLYLPQSSQQAQLGYNSHLCDDNTPHHTTPPPPFTPVSSVWWNRILLEITKKNLQFCHVGLRLSPGFQSNVIYACKLGLNGNIDSSRAFLCDK